MCRGLCLIAAVAGMLGLREGSCEDSRGVQCPERFNTKVEGMNANPYGIFGGVARLAGVAHFCVGLNPVRALRYVVS